MLAKSDGYVKDITPHSHKDTKNEKLQMQDHRISYFCSLKLAPDGECILQAFCLNKILPLCCLYLYFLLKTFRCNL